MSSRSGEGIAEVRGMRMIKDAAIELRQEDGAWSVYLDGKRTVDRESFTVADQVVYALTHPVLRGGCVSETIEVAASITTHYARS
jgi:hypothetical protein